ncbi:MAG: hypothetical protein ABJA67_10510 [Chthonomonadales bacterium]
MAKSGEKMILIGLVSTAVGVGLAMISDNFHGNIFAAIVFATLILCLGGVAVFLLGCYKFIVGKARRER